MTSTIGQTAKISGALLLIYLGGHGVGYLMGSRNASPPPASPSGTAVSEAGEAWSNRALARMEKDLDLTQEQVDNIRPVIKATAEKVALERERALFQIYLQVLGVHDEIEPVLDRGQLAKLEESRRKMQESIRERFSELLDAAGGDAPGSLPRP